MKHCDKCNVNVNSNSLVCPLCYGELHDDGKPNIPLYDECSKKPKIGVKGHFITRLFALLSIIAIAVCLFINIVTKGKPWSFIVISSIIYLWVLIRHTILSLRNTFEKVFLQLLCLALLLVSTSFMSADKGWFLNYVLPSMLIAASVALLLVLFISGKRKLYLFSFLIIFLIMIVVGAIFWGTKFAEFKLLYQILVILNALIVLGIMLMDFKTVRQEFLKKFHL